MKLFHFYQQQEIHLGVADENRAVDITHAGITWTWREIFQNWARCREEFLGILQQGKALDLEKVTFAPASLAGKILCVGLNYPAHQQEGGFAKTEYPTIFMKTENARAAHGEAISLPTCAQEYDYEGEFVIVIGRKIHVATIEEATAAIFGYTIGNDLSARDLQFRTSQWNLGKSLDGFAPLGPYIVPKEDMPPKALNLETYVNGQKKQDATTDAMLWQPPALVQYISQYMTLMPGDVIFTGTPEGVILGEKKAGHPCNWLQAGDVVEVRIEGVGCLRNVLT